MGRHSGWVVDGFLLGRSDGEEEMFGSVQQRGLSLYGLCYMLCIVIYYILNSGGFVPLILRKHRERCSPSSEYPDQRYDPLWFRNGLQQCVRFRQPDVVLLH